MSDLLSFISSNLLHILPILVAGCFAAAIIAERAIALMSRYPIRNSDAFFEKITSLVMDDRLAEAVDVCDRLRGKPAAQVVKQGLLRAHQPEPLIENGLEIAASQAVQHIQKRTGFLSMIANVATLLGLFGTIAGLIHSFKAVGAADPGQKSAMLAQGISTAMNATMLGLAVAIPSMVAFSFLMNRSNRLVAEVDEAAVRVFDILRQRFYSAVNGGENSGKDGGIPRNRGRSQRQPGGTVHAKSHRNAEEA